jgi:hypothetical protein
LLGKNLGSGGRAGYDNIIKHWPTDIQILCMNCQWIKKAENAEVSNSYLKLVS